MSRNLLMQSILGHLSLLQEKYPEKAASDVARQVRRAAKMSLKAALAAETSPMKMPAPQKPLRRAA
jgi:hypothetical protein